MSSRDIAFKIISGVPKNPPLVLLRFVYWSWAGLTINFKMPWMYENITYVNTQGKEDSYEKHYHYNINFMFKGKHFFIDKVYNI